MDSSKLKLKFMEFPHVPDPTTKLMVELISALEEKLGSSLQPNCNLAPDVQHFGNTANTAQASLHLRSGLPSSQIDFMLGGWIHSQLPSGGALNITTLLGYLKSSIDAPHFLLELIQTTPTSLVLIFDLTPRKDLIMHPDHLKTYYVDTQLDKHRQHLLTSYPLIRPFFSPSLPIRAGFSPTAILVTIDTGAASESKSIEQIVEYHISPIAKEMLHFWIESCACLMREVEESERAYLSERGRIIKKSTIEVNLGSSFPMLFRQQVFDKVLGALNDYYDKRS